MEEYGRTAVYVHLDAVEKNFEEMRGNLNPETKMIAVVKTDGYGHGAVPIAKRMEEKPYIWGFAVAAVSEAVQLRENGIQKPVLILGHAFPGEYGEIVAEELRPAVFSLETAKRLSQEGGRQNRTVRVHLAVDTGMSRIGYADTEESIEEIVRISRLPNLKIEGIFTHFSKADEADQTYTMRQLERFQTFCRRLEEAGIKGILRHCSNSAALMQLSCANLDLVRAGISLYGIYPSCEVAREPVRLTPVLEWKARVACVKEIPKGTLVSYGGLYEAPKTRKIATVSAGYGDGYPRSLSGRGYVLIKGKKAPILGRICMDQFMVDVTGIPVLPEEEVTLVGRDLDAEITVDELAELSGRFPYEFVCDIGKRVPRIYVG